MFWAHYFRWVTCLQFIRFGQFVLAGLDLITRIMQLIRSDLANVFRWYLTTNSMIET